MYVPGKAETIKVDWLVDTGCSVTILSEKSFCSLSIDDRPELQAPSNHLVSADGSPFQVLGEANFNIQIGSHIFSQLTVVAKISDEGILGMDFLKTHEILLDFQANKLITKDENIQTQSKSGPHKACRVTLAEHNVLPGRGPGFAMSFL